VEAPFRLRERARFQVLCGTSIGALNIAIMAAHLHEPAVGVRRLVNIWKNLDMEELLPISLNQVMNLPAWLLGRNKHQSFFMPDPIIKLIKTALDWEMIHANLNDFLADAISISCTQVPTGKTVIFYETADGRPRQLSRDPHVRPVYVRINADHIRASASIPFVFPATLIDGIPYVDGGLRQNTPLSPALRLGSERLLAVGLGYEKRLGREGHMPDWQKRLNNPIFLMGKVLNSLMLEQVDYDLIRLAHMNQLIEEGEQAFGPSFIDRLNSTVKPIRGAAYRKVPHVVLRPSQEIARMAAEHVRGGHLSGRGMSSKLTRMLVTLEPEDAAELTSLLLFDGGFCEKLINLGIEDARSRQDDLMRLFS